MSTLRSSRWQLRATGCKVSDVHWQLGMLQTWQTRDGLWHP